MMNTAQYIEFLMGCLDADIASITLARPGIGKTSLARKVSQITNRPLIIVEGSYIADETYLQGIPFAIDGKTTWLPPAQLEIPDNAIIFIDDIALCSAQHLLYPLILDKRIDTRQLPDTVSIMAAGNREEDNGSRYSFTPILGNRAAVCMEFEGATAKEWLSWAMENRINPTVITAIQFYPELLNQWNPNNLRNPTPRSWELASKLLDKHVSPIVALTTTLGTKTASAVEIVVSKAREMVQPQHILDGSANVPKDPMIGFVTLANLNRVLNSQCNLREARNTLAFVSKVLDMHSGSMVNIAVQALAKVPGLSKLPEYQRFMTTYGSMV
jgi:hypothetical protein